MGRKILRGRAALTALLFIAAACSADRPPRGEMQLNDAFSSEFALVDMYGEPASDERFAGKPMLIYYGFTSCPDVCPAALGVLTATLDALGSDAGKLQPLFITVDPERDNPERLKNHLAFDDRILGLTGSEKELEDNRKRMRVYAGRVDLPGSASGYTVDHQSLFFLVDERGAPIVAFDDSMAPKVMASRIKRHL